MGNKWKKPRLFRVVIVEGLDGAQYERFESAARRAAAASRARAQPVRVERRQLLENGRTGPWREVPEAEWRATLSEKERSW